MVERYSIFKLRSVLQHTTWEDMPFRQPFTYQHNLGTTTCGFAREEVCLGQRKPCADSQETKRKKRQSVETESSP